MSLIASGSQREISCVNSAKVDDQEATKREALLMYKVVIDCEMAKHESSPPPPPLPRARLNPKP